MSHVDGKTSAAVMRDRIDAIIEAPPKPLRSAWGTTRAAVRGAAAAVATTSGPAPTLTDEQRAERARRKAQVLEAVERRRRS